MLIFLFQTYIFSDADDPVLSSKTSKIILLNLFDKNYSKDLYFLKSFYKNIRFYLVFLQ